MKTFVDSSILIEAMVAGQPHQLRCAELVAEATDTATHCLAESFNRLTGGRLGFRVRPAEAAKMLRQLTPGLTLTSLSGPQMLACLDSAHRRGARGGAIHDLLILEAARLAKAKAIWTLDLSDFRALAPDLDLRSPAQS